MNTEVGADIANPLGVPSNEAPAGPPADTLSPRIIKLAAGSMAENLAGISAILAATGRYCQTGGRLVELCRDHVGGAHIYEVTSSTLLRDFDALATWQSERSGAWVRCEAPLRLCRVMINAVRHEHFPLLMGVARQPYIRSNGTLGARSGYDASSGLYGDFDEGAFRLPPDPTKGDAKAALDCLLGLLSDFPFVQEHDRSATLAALLTAVVRPSLEAAPMFHVRAPQIGSGKSYLCSLITAFASASRGAPVAFPGSDEECTKVLASELKQSPSVIEFDNLTTDILPHKTLCSALTAPHLRARVLGSSKMVQISTKALILSSGNNVGPVRDMARRCVTINLDPDDEVPAARSYTRPHLVRDVLADRARYVSAALTIVRAWICAGSPRATCQTLSGYGDWNDWCRHPLLWLGLPDPAKSVFEAIAHDPDRELLGSLMRAVSATFGDAPVMVKKIIERAREHDAPGEDLMDVLQEIAGERGAINSRRLGHWIVARTGRQVDGLKFVKQPTIRNATCWKVLGGARLAAPPVVMMSDPAPATALVVHPPANLSDGMGAVESVRSVESVQSVQSVPNQPGKAEDSLDDADGAGTVEEAIEFSEGDDFAGEPFEDVEAEVIEVQ
jgi:hypothetical protein